MDDTKVMFSAFWVSRLPSKVVAVSIVHKRAVLQVLQRTTVGLSTWIELDGTM